LRLFPARTDHKVEDCSHDDYGADDGSYGHW
jgi:hypothetical protein